MNHLEVIFKNDQALQNDFHVSLKGELNNMNAINFKKDLLRLINNETEDCTVNITELDSIDLTGLNALVMAHRSLQTEGKRLTIVCKKEDKIDSFLQMTQFDQHLHLQRA